MNINRNNYEEFLLLYADNELTFSQRQAVEDFLEANPDLKTELQTILNSKLRSEHIPFFNKAKLYKNEAFITDENYASYFLLYADNELTEEEKRETEKYATNTPALQKEFELIQQAKVEADEAIVFPDKSILYRKEEPARVVRISWVRIAAAAVLIGIVLVAGILVLNKKPLGSTPELVKKEAPARNKTGNENGQPLTTPSTPFSDEDQSIAIAEENDKLESNNDKLENVPGINQKLLQKNIAIVKPNVKENKNEKLAVTNTTDNSSGIVKNDVAKELNKLKDAVVSIETTLEPTATMKAGNPKEIVDVAVGPVNPNEYARSAVRNDDDNSTSIGVFNVSDEKVQKSGLRGLFRKVKRVIGRRNNNDDNEQESKKIYIGNFAIARGN